MPLRARCSVFRKPFKVAGSVGSRDQHGKADDRPVHGRRGTTCHRYAVVRPLRVGLHPLPAFGVAQESAPIRSPARRRGGRRLARSIPAPPSRVPLDHQRPNFLSDLREPGEGRELAGPDQVACDYSPASGTATSWSPPWYGPWPVGRSCHDPALYGGCGAVGNDVFAYWDPSSDL